jgi:AraC-like DNA-binding protein
LVETDVRDIIDLATIGAYGTVHTSSLADAMEAVRHPAARALLLSPCSFDPRDAPVVRRLILSVHGVTTAAVVAEGHPVGWTQMLTLGACGVKSAVDLSSPSGMEELRMLGRDATREVGQRILAVLADALADASCATKLFFDRLIVIAPRATTVRELARTLGVRPTTLVSRFYRCGLPSARTYLAEVRMLYALAYLEDPAKSVASVARHLDYSSPQSFGRHVRVRYGRSTSELRRELPFDTMMRKFLREHIVPYWKTFVQFTPLM